MKRLFLMVLMGSFLLGCGTAVERSEFWKHDTMYRNWDHMKYSWWGYKDPKPDAAEKSQEQEWWGIPTPEGP